MDQPPQTPTGQPDSPGYETRDVGPRGIVLLGSVLTAVTAVVMLMLGWLFTRLDTELDRDDPPVSPLAKDAGPPPGPQLELNLNYRSLEEGTEDRLRHYGWIDKPQGIVHIPIERAMQILAERGLPEPSEPVQPPDPTDQK